MTIEIYPKVKNVILSAIRCHDAESGGIIACDRKGIVVDFYFDRDAGTGRRTYIPSRETLNRHINDVWGPQGYHFIGIVHSHPEVSPCALSREDIRAGETILRYNQLQQIILMVVQKKRWAAWYIQLGPKDDVQMEPCEFIVPLSRNNSKTKCESNCILG